MAVITLPHFAASELVASGLFLRRTDAPLWLMLRATKHGEWGFPKGHSEPGEDLTQTALRECAEETGIALVELIAPPLWATYTVPSGRHKTAVYFPALTATVEVVLSDEHDRFRWCTTAEALALIGHPNLRSLFRTAVKAWPC